LRDHDLGRREQKNGASTRKQRIPHRKRRLNQNKKKRETSGRPAQRQLRENGDSKGNSLAVG